MSINLFDELEADPETMARLHLRLEREATEDDLLDVAYRTVDSPVGKLLLAATTVGLVRVAYDVQDHDAVLAKLASAVSPRVLRAPARLDDAARQLDEYFAKRRTEFEVPVDLRLAEGFRRSVIEHLRDIGYGRRRELRRRGHGGRKPTRGPRRRLGLRAQSLAGRHPVPPCRSL